MKKSSFWILLLSLAIIITLSSCAEESRTADMKITLEKEISRTFKPDDFSLSITNYQIVCTGPSGETHTFNSKRNTAVLEGVPIGSWSITAEGRNDNNVSLVRGSTTFNLNETNTSATVVLNEMIGTGDIAITYNWDNTLVRSPRLEVTLTGDDNAVSQTITPTITASSNQAEIRLTGKPAGSYTMTAILYDSDTQVAGATKALRIVNGKQTSGSISLNLDAPPAVVGQLMLENKLGTPFACQIVGLSNNAEVPAQQPLTLSLNTDNMNVEDLIIKWYLDGALVSTNRQATITPTPGKHRVDIVAKTKMLGSTGSTEIHFDAAILGKKGEPIFAGYIENGDIKIGGFPTISMLPDGKVLITSNSYNTATVCSIVRNTLVKEKELQLPGQLTLTKVLSANNLVTMACSDNTTVRYQYDMNTKSLINGTSCQGYVFNQDPETKLIKILNILPPTYWIEGYYGIIGITDEHHGVISLRSLTNSGAQGQANSFMGDGRYIYSTFTGDYDIMAVNESGEAIVAIDKETGLIATLKAIDGIGRVKTLTNQGLTGATSAIILDDPDSKSVRFLIAVGDTFKLYKGDVTQGINQVGGAISRSEGTNLNTVSMILSKNGKYLYCLNASTNGGSVSTYTINGDTITYLDKKDISFKPTTATISPVGNYLFVAGNDSSKVAMFKIKTQ